VAKARPEDVPRVARSYIDEALKIQAKHGQSSKAAKEDYAKALADAEEAFGQLATVRRVNGSSAEKQAA
jgi:hypothetical protein